MYNKARYLLSGDKGLIVEFGNEINGAINRKVRNLYLSVQRECIEGIYEMTPTYRSLLIRYNPLEIDIDVLVEKLQVLERSMENVELPPPRLIEIPTLYGGAYGEDIDFVAEHNGLSIEEVIKIHSSADYLVYMLGFTPGFPYLGGMSERIETPRLMKPRTRIPAGSVGIAGKQTGIYPIESPGGWQLIGRTPLRLYDPHQNPPVMLQAGDYIRFVPVDEKEYQNICSLIEKNLYSVSGKTFRESE